MFNTQTQYKFTTPHFEIITYLATHHNNHNYLHNFIIVFCLAINLPLNVTVDTNGMLRTLIVMWEPPSHPDGIITTYMVIHNSTTTDTRSNDTAYTITGLDPYTTYSVSVIACTDNDCGDESDVVIETTEEEGVFVYVCVYVCVCVCV